MGFIDDKIDQIEANGIDIEKGFEWTEERMGKITSSDAKDIQFDQSRAYTKKELCAILEDCGVEHTPSSKKSELEVKVKDNCPDEWEELRSRIPKGVETFIDKKVCEVLTGIPADQFDSDYTDWGDEYEADAIEWYFRKTGNQVEDINEFIIMDEKCGSTPDGMIHAQSGVLEVKCPAMSYKHWRVLKTGEIPDEYVPQLDFHLYVTGYDWVDFVSYDPRQDDGLNGIIIRHERKESAMDQLEDRIDLLYDAIKDEVEKERAKALENIQRYFDTYGST